ncbi:MAG: D-glycero-beta-D-manno-heptose 1,7-bisphosphate 7-phosphatase [Caulobacteraceae bacterium]|nr:D-glycero-beta-D-manno-heptose 1,7-bisphosphate 7-phosphatase [Caulobacteraceae bacterium]
MKEATGFPAPEQCVVLVGGLGTRLGALTQGMPKPLTDVGGRPFLAHLFWRVRRFGFRRVLLLAGHRGEAVRDFAADPRGTEGLEVEVIVEPEPLGTGGALRNALDRLDERFLLLNGDSLFDFNWLDLQALACAHPESWAAMSLRLEADASRFGVVERDGERVTALDERGDAQGGAINGGVYLLRRDVAAACAPHSSFERDVLPRLAAEGRLVGRLQQGFFLDIGVPEALEAAQTLVPGSAPRGAVFFDRDGVLNVDHGYTHRWDEFEWIEGAVEAVKLANDANLFAFLVTNQSGVARGYYAEAAIHELHEAMQQALRAKGAHLDDIRYCPHHVEGVVPEYARACGWRKPEPGMILDLARHWPVDMAHSFLIGDNQSDLKAAAAAGIPAALFEGGRLDQAVKAMIETHAG